MSSFATLDQVAAALLTRVGNELSLRPVSTRVLLRTGVNLRAPRPDQATDKACIAKVVSALAEMGFPL